jgi:hypothetical protein
MMDQLDSASDMGELDLIMFRFYQHEFEILFAKSEIARTACGDADFD